MKSPRNPLKKDADKFWMKWISNFNKSSCIRVIVEDTLKNSDIAVAFSESFSKLYFDSYSDISSYINVWENCMYPSKMRLYT